MTATVRSCSSGGGVVKDTGWAWMTVVGCFIMNFLVVGGAHKSFGILYVEFVDKYGTSSSGTVGIIALSQSLCMLLGPVANMLAVRFTSRRVVMVGGLTICVGFFMTVFAPNIIYLYFSYGLLTGVGCALAYSPSIVTVGQYFDKRRTLANGLAVAGSGVGNFAIPPLIRLCVDEFGLAGALLVLSALMLHVCVAGALLRPPQMDRRQATSHADDQKTAAIESSVDERQSCCRTLTTCCNRLFDWHLLTNTVFLIYGFSAMLIFTGYPSLYIMLPDHAGQIGFSKPRAAFLVSILGLTDVVGRIGFGFFADFNLVPKRVIFVGCMAVAGSLICVLPRIENYVGLAVLCGVTGVFAGAFFTFLMVLLAEKLGDRRLHSAFGLTAMFMGISLVYSAPITGFLRDFTGTWHASYLFSRLSILAGVVILLLDPVAVRYEERKQQRASSRPTCVT